MTPVDGEWLYDLTGRRVSHITVLRYTASVDNWGRRVLECECDCGRRFRRSASELKRKLHSGGGAYCSRSCPVRNAERAPIAVGDRIGHLTVVMVPTNTTGQRICECACDCGRHVRRTVSQLRFANKQGYSSCCSNRCAMRSQHVDTPSLDEQHMIAKQREQDVEVDLDYFDAYIAACRASTLVPEETV
ncbi:MAG: hypothetical protein K2I40_07955 [Bifidobacterium castoris]|nr:hypothetical protein [Bifidobacterium castoris]